ncbi:MAG: NAD(P)H-hydrate dehydratase [Flavobacteriales bacterium AspAUS03]
MKILSSEQIWQADQYTIIHEPISLIDLMERAARACFDWIIARHEPKQQNFFVLVGLGNNGGDGLALARMLLEAGAQVRVCITRISVRCTEAFQTNLDRLGTMDCSVSELHEGDPFPYPDQGEIFIDALFGVGISHPLQAYWADLVDHLNAQSLHTIAIDIPSGLFAGRSCKNTQGIIRSNHTLSFGMIKLPFLLPEFAEYVGTWHLIDIGWPPQAIENLDTPYLYVDDPLVRSIYKPRKKFLHKGSFGHGLIIGGSYGMIGAVVLSAQACLHSGIGKLSVYTPACGYQIIQSVLPEAIVLTDMQTYHITHMPIDLPIEAVGIGPGLGKNSQTVQALECFLFNVHVPLVVDADAINILSDHPRWLSRLSKGTILTPHPKEFSRLVGSWKNDDQKLDLLRSFTINHGFYVVLKGAHTITATPEGHFFFNSTGNSGMATAGSGDVLTGIITGLLVQGYLPKEACILGVYLHGLAGDIAVQSQSQEALIAGDIVKYLGKAYQSLISKG